MHAIRLFSLLAPPLFLIGCGHPVGSEVEKILADSALSDEEAVSATAMAILPHDVINECEASVEKREDGTLILNATHTSLSSITSVDREDLLAIARSDMAKHLWRIFRAGAPRHLAEVSLLHRITILTSAADRTEEVLDLIKVRLTLAQIESISGWDTVDPYDAGEYDILEPAGVEITDQVQEKWTTEQDGSDQLKVR